MVRNSSLITSLWSPSSCSCSYWLHCPHQHWCGSQTMQALGVWGCENSQQGFMQPQLQHHSIVQPAAETDIMSGILQRCLVYLFICTLQWPIKHEKLTQISCHAWCHTQSLIGADWQTDQMLLFAVLRTDTGIFEDSIPLDPGQLCCGYCPE